MTPDVTPSGVCRALLHGHVGPFLGRQDAGRGDRNRSSPRIERHDCVGVRGSQAQRIDALLLPGNAGERDGYRRIVASRASPALNAAQATDYYAGLGTVGGVPMKRILCPGDPPRGIRFHSGVGASWSLTEFFLGFF